MADRRSPVASETRQLTLDAPRLRTLYEDVLRFMYGQGPLPGLAWERWRTLHEIRAGVGRGGEASISARLRELRAAGWVVDKRRRGDPKQGLWEYRVSRPPEPLPENDPYYRLWQLILARKEDKEGSPW